MKDGAFTNPISLKNTCGAERKKDPLRRILLALVPCYVDRNALDLANANESIAGFRPLYSGNPNGPCKWDVSA
jgi:hypothetical protein